MDQSLPNYNPANLESPAGIMSERLAQFARRFESCMPAIVVSYDRSTHEAIVKPAINMLLTTGKQVERAEVPVSVWRYMLGGYLIDLPLSAGDTGWIIAADRDTSNFKASSAAAPPNTFETHKYTAGFFLPDSFGTFELDGKDDGRMVIQNKAGTEKISIGESNTEITSASLTITSPLVTITGDANIGGISFLTHVHGGVDTGAGETDVPS